MQHKPLKIGVGIVGTEFPRFVIVNNRKQFWTGTDWSASRRKVMLYAHAWLVQHDTEELKQKKCS